MEARFAFLGAVIFAAGLAACGSGGSGGTPPPTAHPTSTPTATPPVTTTITLGVQPTTAPIPGKLIGTVAVPAGSGTLTIAASTTNPSPAPVIQIVHRARPFAAGGNTALVYFTATATGGPVTLNGLPGFTVTLPAGSPSGEYFVAYYDMNGQSPAWVSTTPTGGQPAGGIVTVPATTTPVISIPSGGSIYLAVYVGGFIPPINLSGCVGVNIARPSAGAANARNAVGAYPINQGNVYTYAGALTQAISRTQPCPQPTATANAAVAIGVTFPNATQEQSVETDAYATNATTVTTLANVALSAGKYLETSETANDLNGNTVKTTYAGSGLQFGQLPEGSGGWTNAPPSSVNQALADGTKILRVYAAAGTYTETLTLPGGSGTNVITVSADGSGSYATGVGNVTVAAPTGGNITLSVFGAPLTIPSWLPAPLKLYSDVTQDLGSVASLPGVCTFRGTGTPEHIRRTIQIVDPVVGYIETETFDTYDLVNYVGSSGPVTLGPVCSTIADTLDEYYDYSLTTPYAFYFSTNAQPVLTNTIREQLSLQSAPLTVNLAGRGASQAFAAQIVARQAGIRFERAMERAAQVRAMMRASAHTTGGPR